MDAAQLFERLGVSGVLFAMVAWGIRQGLAVLDRRLADIAQSVAKTTENHRAEVEAIATINLKKIEAIANAHRDEIISMGERMERLTEKIISRS